MKKMSALEAPVRSQLDGRSDSTLKTLLVPSAQKSKSKYHLIGSCDDRGVARNGGRRGTRFAPQAIEWAFSIMQNNQVRPLGEVSLENLAPKASFEVDQKSWSEYWCEHFGQFFKSASVHIGGGHDHIYPLIQGLDQALTQKGDERAISILNLDAHLDTRTDSCVHSGTPLRQIANNCSRRVHIIQWGIHDSANSKSTCTPLPAPHHTTIISLEETKKIVDQVAHILELIKDDHLIISLDSDAIDGASMRAVSAVNARGLPSEEVFALVIGLAHRANVFGIYEYNPIFEDLSNYGARMLAKLVLSYFEHASV